jgi:hypothetical protein
VAGITFINSGTASPGSVSSFTITYSPSNGDFLIVCIALATTTVSVSSVSDNGSGGGSAYYCRNYQNQTGVRIEIWSTTSTGVAGSPTTITVNLSGPSQVNAIVGEYMGGAALGGVSGIASTGSSGIMNLKNGNGGCAVAASFNICAIAQADTQTMTVFEGNLRTTSVGATVGIALVDQVIGSVGTGSECSVNVTNSTNYASVGIELQPASNISLAGRLVAGTGSYSSSFETGNNGAAFEKPNTAGNLIVICGYVNILNEVFTMSDIAGNAYQPIFVYSDGVSRTWFLYYAQNIVGGQNSVIASLSVFGPVPSGRLLIHEYTTATPSSPLDQSSQGNGTTTGPLDSGSATTMFAKELIFGFGAGGASGTNAVLAAGAGFTQAIEFRSMSLDSITEYKTVTSIGTADAQETLSSGSMTLWVMDMATFIDAGQGTSHGVGGADSFEGTMEIRPASQFEA